MAFLKLFNGTTTLVCWKALGRGHCSEKLCVHFWEETFPIHIIIGLYKNTGSLSWFYLSLQWQFENYSDKSLVSTWTVTKSCLRVRTSQVPGILMLYSVLGYRQKKSPEESKSVLKSTQSSRLTQHRPGDWVTWALTPTECLTLCKSWNLFVPQFQWVEQNSWVLAWLCPSLFCWEDFQECFEAGGWQVVLLCSELSLMLPAPTKIGSFLLSV